MANSNDQGSPPGGKVPGGIAWLGILLLLVLATTALGVSLDYVAPSGNSQETPAMSVAAALVPFNVEDEPSEDHQVPSPPQVFVTAPIPTTDPVAEPTTTPVLATATPTTMPSVTASQAPTRTPLMIPTGTREVIEEAIPWPTITPTSLPLPTPRDTYSWTIKVPILMYHYISEPPEDADKYRQDLSVSPVDFQAQMTYLVENGFETIDLYDLSLAIADKLELPPRPIIITMDDGYRDNYENAFPILEELGLNATFFLVTEFVDKNNQLYLDWAMVEEMAEAGNRFEPHSKTHPDLTIHDRDFIIWEVQGSRETIAAHVGYMPRYFAYPGGRFNEEVQQILAELDFWGAVTTLGGKWNGFNDRYEWTRARIRDVTTLDDFSAMID